MAPEMAAAVRASPRPALERPSWISLSLMTLGGLGCAATWLFWLLEVAKHFGFLPSELGHADAPIGWPWPVTDSWSLTADIGQALVLGAVIAWSIRGVVRLEDLGWDVRLWPLTLLCAVAWVQPSTMIRIAAAIPLVAVTGTVALKPERDWSWQPRRGAKLARTAGAVAVLLIAFGYQPLHPFHGHLAPFGSIPRHGSHPYELLYELADGGPASVTIRSVRVLPIAAHVAVDLGRPYGGLDLPRNRALWVGVWLTPTACPQDAERRDVHFSAFEVRYETLGIARTQRLDVTPPGTLLCRR